MSARDPGERHGGDHGGDLARLDRRWDLVAVGVLVNACLGTVYAWSVFRAPLEETLGVGPAQIGIPYAVFLAAFAFTMPLAGSVLARHGTRWTLVVGGALLGAGWIGAGLSESLPMMVVTYGVVGGAGVGFAYGVPLVVAGSWFPARRGLAMGVTLAGFGLSPFLTAPLAELLIRRFGVSTAMISLGVLFVVVIWLVAPVLRRFEEGGSRPGRGAGAAVPARAGAEEAGATDTEAPGDGARADTRGPRAAGGRQATPAQMLRSRSFYGLWSCYVFGTLAGLTAIGMTASFGQEAAGLSAAAAAGAVSVLGIFNGAGRPLFGAIHDAIGPRATVVLAFVLIAVAAATSLLAGGGSAVAFFCGFGIFWLMLGGWLAIAPAATSRLFGPRHYARNYGIMYTAYGVGALAGSAAAGALHARFGSFDPLFVFILVLCGLGIVVALGTLPGRR
jgi:OFA family oxalate/formate antiporter-like MFS transporter